MFSRYIRNYLRTTVDIIGQPETHEQSGTRVRRNNSFHFIFRSIAKRAAIIYKTAPYT